MLDDVDPDVVGLGTAQLGGGDSDRELELSSRWMWWSRGPSGPISLKNDREMPASGVEPTAIRRPSTRTSWARPWVTVSGSTSGPSISRASTTLSESPSMRTCIRT